MTKSLTNRTRMSPEIMSHQLWNFAQLAVFNLFETHQIQLVRVKVNRFIEHNIARQNFAPLIDKNIIATLPTLTHFDKSYKKIKTFYRETISTHSKHSISKLH